MALLAFLGHARACLGGILPDEPLRASEGRFPRWKEDVLGPSYEALLPSLLRRERKCMDLVCGIPYSRSAFCVLKNHSKRGLIHRFVCA